jgi:hypothetical protein
MIASIFGACQGAALNERLDQRRHDVKVRADQPCSFGLGI